MLTQIVLDDACPNEAEAIYVKPLRRFPPLQCVPIALPLERLPLVTQLVLGDFDAITSYTWSVSGRQLLALMESLPAVHTVSIASVDGAHVIAIRCSWALVLASPCVAFTIAALPMCNGPTTTTRASPW